eukprot:TRINITY_DN4551_c0_g3_i2.p2 TRINITY_DN4551_c0_g3~~TRINITY_DN4551_c0_g3_i2.p2  ORF type:complete len:645 (+),score=122.39 TRINITY_DN4551_c0_g3_i2:112-2046(+)
MSRPSSRNEGDLLPLPNPNLTPLPNTYAMSANAMKTYTSDPTTTNPSTPNTSKRFVLPPINEGVTTLIVTDHDATDESNPLLITSAMGSLTQSESLSHALSNKNAFQNAFDNQSKPRLNIVGNRPKPIANHRQQYESDGLSKSLPSQDMRKSPSSPSVKGASRRGSADSDFLGSEHTSGFSRRTSRMFGRNSRFNLNIPDKQIPSVRNTLYFVTRKPTIIINPVKYLEDISKKMEFNSREFRVIDAFRKHAIEQEAQDIFTNCFWMTFCLFFQAHSEKQLDALITRLSRKFIVHFMSVTYRDFHMKFFPYLLAHGIVNCYWDTFPNDRNFFGVDFRRDILHILIHLQSGIRMLDSLVSSIEAKLFPAGIISILPKSEKNPHDPTGAGKKPGTDTDASAELVWIAEYLSKVESVSGKEAAKVQEAEVKKPVGEVLGEGVAFQHLLVDIAELSDDCRLPKMRMDPIPTQVTDFHQTSPLVGGYFGGGAILSSSSFIEAIDDIVSSRKKLIQESRRHNQQRVRDIEEDRLKSESERYARKREQTFRSIHESYERKKDRFAEETEYIHERLDNECRVVESMKEQVMREGDVAITHLTMSILETQELQRQQIRKNLATMGYSIDGVDSKSKFFTREGSRFSQSPSPKRR